MGYGTKKRRKPDVVARALVAKELARIVYHVLVRSEDRTEAKDFNGQFGARIRARASP